MEFSVLAWLREWGFIALMLGGLLLLSAYLRTVPIGLAGPVRFLLVASLSTLAAISMFATRLGWLGAVALFAFLMGIAFAPGLGELVRICLGL